MTIPRMNEDDMKTELAALNTREPSFIATKTHKNDCDFWWQVKELKPIALNFKHIIKKSLLVTGVISVSDANIDTL